MRSLLRRTAKPASPPLNGRNGHPSRRDDERSRRLRTYHRLYEKVRGRHQHRHDSRDLTDSDLELGAADPWKEETLFLPEVLDEFRKRFEAEHPHVEETVTLGDLLWGDEDE